MKIDYSERFKVLEKTNSAKLEAVEKRHSAMFEPLAAI